MTKTQKITLGIGGLVLASIVAWFFWARRWREFTNIGNSRFLPTDKSNDRLALRWPDTESHNVEVGNRVEIRHNNDVTPDGEATVLDVVNKNGFTYMVTSLKAPYSNPDISGEFRIIG